jgi:hypothetical protein
VWWEDRLYIQIKSWFMGKPLKRQNVLQEKSNKNGEKGGLRDACNQRNADYQHDAGLCQKHAKS